MSGFVARVVVCEPETLLLGALLSFIKKMRLTHALIHFTEAPIVRFNLAISTGRKPETAVPNLESDDCGLRLSSAAELASQNGADPREASPHCFSQTPHADRIKWNAFDSATI
ncbi:hypothetical protein L6164_022899 [Bauhinia variegata]|uniref:Uncharacterized protein n=1 Tax=Bauhinia variegata TaxID=167791 RepID=A0ACB9MH63_BAUVA|nr:hypothetical protein L6164_022899 [Bauhinia variegata]